jgi:non-ribosomal peptide synthetase component F
MRRHGIDWNFEKALPVLRTKLAVLKAGAAYVPLDPMYPADRIAYTCDDANIVRLIATRMDLALEGSREIFSIVELPTSGASQAPRE